MKYDVFDTFSISNLFAAFATQRFILSYVKIKHVVPESYVAFLVHYDLKYHPLMDV